MSAKCLLPADGRSTSNTKSYIPSKRLKNDDQQTMPKLKDTSSFFKRKSPKKEVIECLEPHATIEEQEESGEVSQNKFILNELEILKDQNQATGNTFKVRAYEKVPVLLNLGHKFH